MTAKIVGNGPSEIQFRFEHECRLQEFISVLFQGRAGVKVYWQNTWQTLQPATFRLPVEQKMLQKEDGLKAVQTLSTTLVYNPRIRSTLK